MWSRCCQCFILLAFSSAISAANPAINSLSLKSVLGEQPGPQGGAVFEKAVRPMEFHFPRDHLAHQAYKTEWWYFTGNVSTGNVSTGNVSTGNLSEQDSDQESDQDSDQAFAYQFTLFRFALHPEKNLPGNASAWRSSNIYMAHIALTDIKQGKFYQRERFSRDGLALAGAEKKDDGFVQFWLHDWQAKSLLPERLFPLTLNIQDPQFTLNLQLEASKPMVLNGDQGLSQKSAEHASYYYSYTRLLSRGSIQTGGKTFPVSGNSWFDREWSTSSLGEDQQGWDWFALHLDDGSDLMLYQMRKKNGSKDIYSSGTFVDSLGNSKKLPAGEFQLQAIDFWQSPASGIRYPVKWQLLVPDQNIKLTVAAQVKQQEWSKADGFSFNYWEGAVKVSGIKDHQPISGSGYLEMTGYD
ncbi:MAG: lipocalin-like domain-containing protein [Gammaproteobacteria bacterium]|nr:lipocalin-like domain-containing protein [Gammaproteobacteria bacterium]